MASEHGDLESAAEKWPVLAEPLATWLAQADANVRRRISKRRDPDWDVAHANAMPKVAMRLATPDAAANFTSQQDVESYLAWSTYNEYRRLKRTQTSDAIPAGDLSETVAEDCDPRTESEIEEDQQAKIADNVKKRRVLDTCLQVLSDQQRHVFLSKVEGRLPAEVCQELRIKESNRRKILERARTALEECLAQRGLYWFGFRPEA
jgi:RNA polymerase sigma factor (sigma-70 family)